MPKVTPNPLILEALSGAIGDLLFYRDAEGQFVVQRKGERPAPHSEKQLSHQERFKLASAYGNYVKNDPALSAEYQPLCRGRMSPYQAAVRDFLRPPKVEAIDPQAWTGQPGQSIQILATDDTRVVSVQVVIRQAVSGAIIEQGPAGPVDIANHWIYATTTAIPSGTPILIEATAADRPGNIGTRREHFLVPAETAP